MTELTLHLHAIETNNQGDASFSTIAIALNRDHMAHLAHLYQAARTLKADVAVHHLNCETEHGDLKENTITITPCGGEIECEFADPVPSDWPILLTSSGYLTMDALVKAYAWAEQQEMPCSAFVPRDSRTIYLVANDTLIADPALELAPSNTWAATLPRTSTASSPTIRLLRTSFPILPATPAITTQVHCGPMPMMPAFLTK